MSNNVYCLLQLNILGISNTYYVLFITNARVAMYVKGGKVRNKVKHLKM